MALRVNGTMMSELVKAEDALLPEVVFEAEPDDPAERAKHRLTRLARSFAEVLGTIAQMHRDEDWKYVTREDGSAYTSLAEMLRDNMHISVAMANRYIQGARDLYLPLQELVVQGTPIQITAADVAKLGSTGSREVVDAVNERLTGEEDEYESAAVIAESVAEVKEKRDAERQEKREAAASREERGDGRVDFDGGGAGDDGWDGGFAVDDPSDGRGATVSGEDAYADLKGDDDPKPAGQVEQSLSADDSIAAMMEGAESYDSVEAVEALPEGLREVVEAMSVLARMDPGEVAKLVDFERRGVVLMVEDASTRMLQMRSRVETSPWFMEML